MSLTINLLGVVTFIGIFDQKVARKKIPLSSCHFLTAKGLEDRSEFVRTDVLLGAGFNEVLDFGIAHPLAVGVAIILRDGKQVYKHFFLDGRLDVVHGVIVQHLDFGLG
jgi:hypothetical protein